MSPKLRRKSRGDADGTAPASVRARGGDGEHTPRWMRELEVPECPEGWRTGPPDFVGVGAQRSGTSWWYRGTLRDHPSVVRIAKPGKELHYFDRFWQGGVPDDFVERYHELFPRPEGSITGEWTPRYMVDFWSMPLLRRAAPEAKILVMLRDPIERFRSGMARELELAEDKPWPFDLATIGDQVLRSMYFDQMRRLFEVYPREQVLVLQYERCKAEPVAEMRRTHEFLGIEPLDELPERAAKRKRPPREKPELEDWMGVELVGRLEADVDRLAELCPEIDPELWPSFRRA